MSEAITDSAGRVFVIDPHGIPGTISAREMNVALSRGYRLADRGEVEWWNARISDGHGRVFVTAPSGEVRAVETEDAIPLINEAGWRLSAAKEAQPVATIASLWLHDPWHATQALVLGGGALVAVAILVIAIFQNRRIWGRRSKSAS